MLFWILMPLALVLLFAVPLTFFLGRPPEGYRLRSRRRRVMREGALADATILAVRWDSVDELERLYTIVYEVCAPGQPPFRAEGFETMGSLLAEDNHVREGARVRVRCDATHQVVVLERVSSETELQRCERMEREQRAREKALLEGGTPTVPASASMAAGDDAALMGRAGSLPGYTDACTAALEAMNAGRYGDAAPRFEWAANSALAVGDGPLHTTINALNAIKAYATAGDPKNAIRFATAWLDQLRRAGRAPEIPAFAGKTLESLRAHGQAADADAYSAHVAGMLGSAWSDPGAPKLPAFCGSCGAIVKPAEVVRPTPTTVACRYCGASLDSSAQ